MNASYRTDVVIIGAGPSGLFAAFECGMLGLKCHIVDALAQPGGQCSALYPEKPIFDIPAIPRILAGQLVEQLLEQVRPFEPTFSLGSKVDRLDREGDRWSVLTSTGSHIDCAAIIFASGAGLLQPNKPDWAGLDRFEQSSVHYSVLSKDAFAGRDIAIAGGGDSAADWAVELAGIARTVGLIHRRDKFRAAPQTLKKIDELIAAGRIEVLAPARVTELIGTASTLSHVKLNTPSDPERIIACTDLLLFFGLVTDTSAYERLGLQVDGMHITVDPQTCATNLSAIYCIGDAAIYPGKLKLILSGFAEAAVAARQAYGSCRPGKELFFEYSTAHGVPSVAIN
ncbi:NAD(P)/FAD-dependent oxidoreductase [Paraburkholderia sediminicola]|uniref:NAD(P)/FAD-dependent oxidoreductase n=1 Tax=Paraburkholderia sediminicola TaxID=458836 RepID=UPI0038B6E127